MTEEHSEGGPATTLAAAERPAQSLQQLDGVPDDPAATPVTLEKLLDYLLASKRSLAATDQVWRANNIVHSAREALVESVELRARSAFLRDGIAGQLKILSRVKNGVENIAWKGRAEFEVRMSTFPRPAERARLGRGGIGLSGSRTGHPPRLGRYRCSAASDCRSAQVDLGRVEPETSRQ